MSTSRRPIDNGISGIPGELDEKLFMMPSQTASGQASLKLKFKGQITKSISHSILRLQLPKVLTPTYILSRMASLPSLQKASSMLRLYSVNSVKSLTRGSIIQRNASTSNSSPTPSKELPQLTLFTGTDCSLCDVAKEVLEEAKAEVSSSNFQTRLRGSDF